MNEINLENEQAMDGEDPPSQVDRLAELAELRSRSGRLAGRQAVVRALPGDSSARDESLEFRLRRGSTS